MAKKKEIKGMEKTYKITQNNYEVFVFDYSLAGTEKYKYIANYQHIGLSNAEQILGRKGKRVGEYHDYVFEATDVEIEKLKKYSEEQEAEFQKALKEEAQEEQAMRRNGLCSKCGTFCYGACED